MTRFEFSIIGCLFSLGLQNEANDLPGRAVEVKCESQQSRVPSQPTRPDSRMPGRGPETGSSQQKRGGGTFPAATLEFSARTSAGYGWFCTKEVKCFEEPPGHFYFPFLKAQEEAEMQTSG